MRTKSEILNPIKELCEGVTNDPEAAWHGYVEHAKLEIFLDIRDLLADLITTLEDIENVFKLGKQVW